MTDFGRFLSSVREPDGLIRFWEPEYVERACALIGLPQEIAEAFRQEAERVRSGGEGEIGQAVLCHRELFIERLPPKKIHDRLLAKDGGIGMFAALVYLGGLPEMMAAYAARGIGEDVLIETMDDLKIWMRRQHTMTGRWGLVQLGWLHGHLSAKLFRLGRLQFAAIAFRQPVIALRHRTTREVTALALPGVRFRSDGFVDGTNGIYDPENGWEPEYSFDGLVHRGSVYRSGGFAERNPVELSDAEWEVVLRQGDTVLDVHIPEGSKMSHEQCNESYMRAAQFFASHFPELTIRGFVCSSWLLSPQLGELLPPESNIVRFQRDYRIIPVRSDESQTLERVFGFGTKLADLPAMPRETTLQIKVYEHLTAGKPIHGAAGFILMEDVG